MKLKILAGLFAMILLAGAVFALEYVSPYPYGGSSIYTDVGRSGPQRISDYDIRVQEYKISTTVELVPPVEEGYDYFTKYRPFYPRATARVDSRRHRYYPRSHVVITTKDIEPSYKTNNVYEGWLYDADTGYRLSMGIFKASMGGVGRLEYRSNSYLDPYDFIVITSEPYPDPDPLPGEIILVGPIEKQDEYYRPFTYQEEMYGYED